MSPSGRKEAIAAVKSSKERLKEEYSKGFCKG